MSSGRDIVVYCSKGCAIAWSSSRLSVSESAKFLEFARKCGYLRYKYVNADEARAMPINFRCGHDLQAGEPQS